MNNIRNCLLYGNSNKIKRSGFQIITLLYFEIIMFFSGIGLPMKLLPAIQSV